MEKEIKLSLIVGVIAGLLIILTGVLTALKITPPIAALGLEVGLGIWRIFAVLIVLIASIKINKYPPSSFIIIALGLFEILVFFVEKDYSILTISPFIAILAGILGILKK